MSTEPLAMDQARAHVMAHSLSRLLDRVRGSREVLPHLAALETALLQRGLAVLDNASVTVLRRISTQLASLPVADDDAPLQDLQLRLLGAMERRVQDTPAPAAPPSGPSTVHGPFVSSVAPRPGFGDSVIGQDKVEVRELSHSAFMAAQQGEDTAPAFFHAAAAAAGHSR
jgi:hypothetical protein